MNSSFRRLLAILLITFIGNHWASASPIIVGIPTDPVFGCNVVIGIDCSITLDEHGNISVATDSTIGNKITADHVASTVNPAWVDDSGIPIKVTSYLVNVSLVGGIVALCEDGANDIETACIGPQGDRKSHVLIFTNLVDLPGEAGRTRIDFLSASTNPFSFLTSEVTDVHIHEGEANHPAFLSLADSGNEFIATFYGPRVAPESCELGFPGYCERINYTIITDKHNLVPEPASLGLLGLGLLGLKFSQRKKLSTL